MASALRNSKTIFRKIRVVSVSSIQGIIPTAGQKQKRYVHASSRVHNDASPEKKQSILDRLWDSDLSFSPRTAHSKTLTANPATYELQC